MEEFFNNKYVVQIEHGHPGYTTYTVFSTREHMTALTQALSEALAKPEDSLRESCHPSDASIALWSDYATIAYGQTSRVSLVFRLVHDLAPFHVRPSAVRHLAGYARCLVIVLVLGFAAIGVVAAIRLLLP